jgi:glycosyltransferase 2 family protein
VLFSTRLHWLLQRVRPLLRVLRVERPLREVYLALHSFRANARLLVSMFALTLVVQAVRVLAIWCAGKAVGVDLSPRPYYVMGPLLFLVMLVPFTVNGLAVRESFFVSFLGTLGVPADRAFATGFLFFVVTIALSLPGAAIVGWEGLRGGSRAAIQP